MAENRQWTWARDLLRLVCPHAGRTDFAGGHHGRNRISFHRLFLVPRRSRPGSTVDDGEGGRLELRPGSVSLLPADRMYTFRFAPGLLLTGFHFRLETPAGIDVLHDAIALQQRQDPRACDEAWLAQPCTTPGGWLVAEAMLRLHLGRTLRIDWQAVGRAVHDASVWGGVLEHLAHADAGGADIAGLARTAGLSRERFSRRFRDRFHLTPRDWHRRSLAGRITAALLEDDRPLAEVAAAFGFSDAFALSRFVRHSTGRSPSQLRASGGFAG